MHTHLFAATHHQVPEVLCRDTAVHQLCKVGRRERSKYLRRRIGCVLLLPQVGLQFNSFQFNSVCRASLQGRVGTIIGIG
jgi:hypothetical protein